MATVYNFYQEMTAMGAGLVAAGDRFLIFDTSAGTILKVGASDLATYVHSVADTFVGTQTFSNNVVVNGNTDLNGNVTICNSSADLLSIFGGTAINRGSMAATAVTALATATISAANTSAVWGFASSTVANSYMTRIDQMQVDLDTLMARINSTNLIEITGL